MAFLQYIPPVQAMSISSVSTSSGVSSMQSTSQTSKSDDAALKVFYALRAQGGQSNTIASIASAWSALSITASGSPSTARKYQVLDEFRAFIMRHVDVALGDGFSDVMRGPQAKREYETHFEVRSFCRLKRTFNVSYAAGAFITRLHTFCAFYVRLYARQSAYNAQTLANGQSAAAFCAKSMRAIGRARI